MADPLLVPAGTARALTLADGRTQFAESLARPGDVVEIRALMDAVVAVSACPMDLNPISGYRVTDLALEVT